MVVYDYFVCPIGREQKDESTKLEVFAGGRGSGSDPVVRGSSSRCTMGMVSTCGLGLRLLPVLLIVLFVVLFVVLYPVPDRELLQPMRL